jgi:cobalt-zinc-cadmium efflux system membrane fusion protein
MKRGIGCVAAGLLLLMAACGSKKEQAAVAMPDGVVCLTEEQDRNMRLNLFLVEERPVGGEIRTFGRLAFDDHKVAHVFSPVSGRILRLVADLGQKVRPGQTLALLDSPDMGSALSDAHKAEAALVAADREFARQKELYAAHAGAKRELESAEAAYQTALAERDRARERASLLGAASGHAMQGFQLRAPIGGEVIARNATPGMELQGQYGGGSGAELYTIGDIDRLWLMLDLPEMDLFRVRPGCPVTFGVSGDPSLSFTTRIDWVAGALDPNTRTAKARCVVTNPKKLLKPEMLAQVRIQVPERRRLALPRQAVVRLGSLTYAFVEVGWDDSGRHRFERRPIEVDEHEMGDLLPVKSGLKAGEKVVGQGAILLAGLG